MGNSSLSQGFTNPRCSFPELSFFNTTTFHKLQRNRKSENDSYTMARVGNRTLAKNLRLSQSFQRILKRTLEELRDICYKYTFRQGD